MEEWDLIDKKGKPVGRTMRRGDAVPPGLFHLVVHIWVQNSRGEVLIQKRADTLSVMPGEWAATSGSAVAEEDSVTAARRELAEELGIYATPGEMRWLGRMHRPHSLSDLWLVRRDVNADALTLQAEEVAAVRWVTWKQLRRMVEQGEFHDYGRAYFRLVGRRLYGFRGRPRRTPRRKEL